MEMSEQINKNRFLIKRSELNTLKLFVEFYLPEYQVLLNQLRESPYPLKPLKEISQRLFAGPFGSDRKVEMYQSSGIPYLRVKDVLPGKVDESDLVYISPEKHHSLNASKVVSGDVIMTIAGRLGTAAVFPEELREGNITGHIAGIEPKEEVNPHYLALFLNSRFGEFQVARWGHRTTRPELNLSEIGQILVTVPPREVQDRIAHLMQEAYATRQAKLAEAQHLLDGLEQYLLGTMGLSDVLPNDDPRFIVNSSKLHRADVRYFSPFFIELEKSLETGKYGTKTLQELCEVIVNGLTPARDEYTVEGFNVIKVASLTKDWRVNWENIACTSERVFKKAKKAYLKENDFLLLSASHQLDYIGSSFGLVLNIPEELVDRCMAVGELIIIRTNSDELLPKYLLSCFILKPIQLLVNRMTRGQSAHLYANDLQTLRIPLAPLHIQKIISDEIDNRRSQAKLLRAQADAIISKAKAQVERMILGEEGA